MMICGGIVEVRQEESSRCRESGWCNLTGDKMVEVESGGGSGRGTAKTVVGEAHVIATEAVRSQRDRGWCLVAVRHVKVA